MPAPRPLAGMGRILERRSVRGALLTVLATSVLCAPLATFSPVLIRDVFHGTAGRFSATLASFGAGGLLGASALLSIGPQFDRRRLSSAFAIVYGAVVILAALAPWFWALPLLFVVAGASMTISNTSANTLLQASANPRLLGQTVSLYMLAMSCGMSVGAVLTGATVTLFGVRHALLLDGLTAVVLQATLARAWISAGNTAAHGESPA